MSTYSTGIFILFLLVFAKILMHVAPTSANIHDNDNIFFYHRPGPYFILINIYFQIVPQNHVTLKMRMISYFNEGDQLANGRDCEIVSALDHCDPYFIFCLSTDAHPIRC